MAYLRRFTGILSIFGIFACLVLLAGSNTQKHIIKEALFREAPDQKIFENQLLANLVKLRPGNIYRPDSKPTLLSSQKCQSLVYQSLIRLPQTHRSQLKELTLFYTTDGRRGLGGNGSIILRCRNVTDSELISVFMHEIGHLVDASLFKGNSQSDNSSFYDFDVAVKIDDPSLLFYEISWESDTAKKQEATELDFVSLYAATDPFEDFAETYTYYRLHGPEFRKLTASSRALQEKYEFMKTFVFEGQEFGALEASEEKINILHRFYDVTVLPFSLGDFLNV